MRPIDRSQLVSHATGHSARPRRRRLPVLVVAAVWAALAAAPAPASARSEKTLAYPRDQAWPTAVRFLVVDERVKVTEKDGEAGYVMFELSDDGKRFRGSLELVTLVRDGRTVVRFVLQIPDRPSWVEIAMLGRLERKLRAELGSPSPAPDAPAKKPAPRPEPPPPAPEDGAPPRSDDGPRITTAP